MLKLLLLSVVFVPLLLSASAARSRKPRRAFLALLFWVLVMEVGYVGILLVVYPRLAFG